MPASEIICGLHLWSTQQKTTETIIKSKEMLILFTAVCYSEKWRLLLWRKCPLLKCLLRDGDLVCSVDCGGLNKWRTEQAKSCKWSLWLYILIIPLMILNILFERYKLCFMYFFLFQVTYTGTAQRTAGVTFTHRMRMLVYYQPWKELRWKLLSECTYFLWSWGKCKNKAHHTLP